MAQGLERIPLAVDSDFKSQPVRANFPDAPAQDFKLVSFEPDQVQTPPAPQARSMGTVAADTAYGMAKGAGSLAKGIGWLAGSDGLQQAGQVAEDYWGEKQSADLHRQLEEVGKAEGVTGTLAALGNNPGAIGDYIAASLPMMIPGMAVGSLGARGIVAYAGNAARGAALRAGATEAAAMQAGRIAAEKAAEKAAMRFAVGANMLGEGAVSGGVTGAEVEKFALEHGATPEQAKASANKSALMAGAWTTAGAGIGAGMETRAMLGRLKDSGIKGMVKNVAKEAAEEAIQNPGEDYAAYAGKVPYDSTQTFDPGKAATLGAVTGGAMGAGFHAAGRAGTIMRGEGESDNTDGAIPANDIGAGPGGGGIDGEFIPAGPPPALANQPGGTTYDQSRPELPPGQTMLPRLALPAPEDGGPSERQVSTAIGLLKHSPKASPDLLQRLMRVDQTMATMLFNHWQGQTNGQVAGNEAAEIPAQGDQGQGADIAGGRVVDGFSDGAVSFTPDTAAEVAAPGGEPGMALGAAGPDAVTALDVQAHAAATSPFNATPQPTEAQKQAGNYKKGKIKFQGMDISIENPAGSVRSGTNQDGKAWENTLQHHYGYIRGSTAKDGDHVDVFIKPGAQTARTAYVIDQIDPKTGKYDEAKVILGADSEADAKAIYHANYEQGWQGMGAITAMPIDQFKGWIKSGKTKKPVAYAEPKEIRTASRTPKTASSLLQAIVNRGGISREIMQDVGGDPAGRYMPGLFTKTGTTDLSALASYLFDEDGFHQIRQDSDIGPARELEDLITRALGGEKVLSTMAMEKGAQAEETARLKEKAQRLGVKTVARKLEDIAAEVAQIEERNILDEETRLEDDALVAYNEAVDALNAAVGEDAAENFLEDLASRYQDETHLNYLRNATTALQEKLNAEVQSAGKPDETAAGQAGSGDETGRAQGGAGSLREEARPALTLSSQSEAELAAAAKAAQTAEAQRLKDEQAAENKRQADAERGSFNLTGSDRPADVLAAQGQGDIFAQPNQEARSTTPVAESQVPATSEPGDAGVAPGRNGAAPDTIAGKSVTEMSDDQLRNIARGLSQTFGETAVDKAREELAKRGLGYGPGNNDAALIAKLPPQTERERRINDLSGRGLYDLPEDQRASLLKTAKVRSVDAFEDIAISDRREIIGRWIDGQPVATQHPAIDRRPSVGAAPAWAKVQMLDGWGNWYWGSHSSENFKVGSSGNLVGLSNGPAKGSAWSELAVAANRNWPKMSPEDASAQWVEVPAQGGEKVGAGETAKDEIDQRISDAEASGVSLSDNDKANIRAAFERADELSTKASRIMGRGADPYNKGNAFPLGVGFTKETKRSNQRLDASVRRAGEAVQVFNKAEAARKYADSLLAGKGTEADKALKIAKQERSQRELVKRLVNWKKGDKIGKFTIERVSNDGAGYPSSYTISGEGIVKGVFDKVDVAREFFDGSKDALHRTVDEVRADEVATDKESLTVAQGKETHASLPNEEGKEKIANDRVQNDEARDGFAVAGGGVWSKDVGDERKVIIRRLMVDGVENFRVTFSDDEDLGRHSGAGGLGTFDSFEDAVAAVESAIPADRAKEDQQDQARRENHNIKTTLAEHDATTDRLRDGTATLAEYKAAFQRLQNSTEELTAEFAAMKKDDILKHMGGMAASRYKSDTKAQVVTMAVRDLMDDFSIGRGISYSMGGRDAYANAVRAQVERTTDADLAEYAEHVKSMRAAQTERVAQVKAAMKDPKTLDDFEMYLRAKMAEGDLTLGAARMTMTPEQRVAFDELAAEKSRAERKSRGDQQRTDIRVAATTTEGQIVETKHTKTGEPLFVVKAAERVERDVYNHWNATAKKLGGWYSSYRGGGAVPGFQFKTRENADAFLAFIGGNVEQAKEAVQTRRDAFEDDRGQTAVERLTEMADRLEERADESLNRERKENTDRRARMAASAEAAANSDKSLAKTMRNIAKAIASGKTKFLDRVRQKAQVEMLRGFLHTAKANELRAKFPNYGDQEKHRSAQPTAETADYVDFPRYTAFRSDLATMGRQMLDIDGAKKVGATLLKVADDVSAAYLAFAKEHLHQVSTFKTGAGKAAVFASKDDADAAIKRSGFKGKAIVLPFKRGQNIIIQSPSMAKENGIWKGDDDKRITLTPDFGEEVVAKVKEFSSHRISMPYLFESVRAERARLKSIGIETAPELRAALREFIDLRAAPPEVDKIKQMERAMIGRKNDGLDFFPTPASVADELVQAAGIEEGMAVLEPSAGMGHIAERIRASGVDPDVVEMASDRRDLLEAKGFRLVGSDFMDMNPRDFTYGDVFRAPDGTLGVMRGSGGMGSNRVGLDPLDANGQPEPRRMGWYDRDELKGVEKRAGNSGYDRIIMNPPFSDRRDAQHVQHAYTLLKPGGRLVAIMGEGVFFGQDKKAQAFRDWLEEVGGTSEKLEDGAFLDPSLPVNTGVNARMVVIEKPEGKGMESRAAPGDLDFAAQVTAELAADDDAFRWPVSKSASLKTVFSEVYPGAQYFGEHTRADERDETDADHRHVFLNHLGKRFYVYERDGGRVWIDVSQLANGDRGNQIYAAVANWAYNANKKFQGDPAGVSADATIRRTSAMLSSALRFGTTRHLDAAPEQIKGDPQSGIEPLKWSANDLENLRELIHTFITTLYNKFPKLNDYRYDFTRKGFFDKNGDAVTDERFRAGARTDFGQAARAGEGTLRRGVFLKSLVSSESGARPGILEDVLNRGRSLIDGGLKHLLSKATPAQAGVSASGGTESTRAIQSVVDKFLKQFAGAAALNIRVVRTIADIPARFRPSPFAEGVFHDGAGLIYLVAMNLKHANGQVNTGRAWQVLMHEAVGHFGLAQMMGDRFKGVLKEVMRAARASGAVEEDIYAPGHPDYATVEAVRLRYPEASDEEVAQEVLARMAETDPGRTLFGYVRAVVRQWLRDMARAAGITLDVTTAELNDLVAQASRYMRRGDGVAQGVDVDALGVADMAVGGMASRGAGMESRRAPTAGQPKEPRTGILDTILRKAGGEVAAKITGPAYDKLTAYLGGKMPEGIKAGMVSDYGLDESYVDRRTGMQTEQQKAARQTKTFVEGMMGLDRAQSRVAYQWLNNRGAEADRLMAQLPAESQQVLKDIKIQIAKLTIEAVRLGQLDAETAERNFLAYLHRSYAKYDLNTDDKTWKAERAKAIKILGDQYKGRGLKMDVDPDRIHSAPGWWQDEMKGKRVKVLKNEAGRFAFVAEGTAIPPNLSGYKLEGVWEIRARKAADRITLWRDFTQDERQMMGELDEAKYAVARTLFMMNRDIEVGRFHEWVADEYAKTPEEAEEEGLQMADASDSMMRAFTPDEWVTVPTSKIPGTGVFKFGALAGMVVPGPVWNDIRQISAGRFEPFGAAYASILRAWKLSKTALTPTTHVNNIMGNFVMADMHDVGARDAIAAVRLMVAAANGDKDAKAMLDRFEDSGATQGMFTTHELKKEVLEPLLQQLREEVGMADDEAAILKVGAIMSLALHGQFGEAWAGAKAAAKQSTAGRVTGAVVTKAQDYYQAEDSIFRLAAFLKSVDEGKTDLEAGKLARKAFLDYHINAPWINAMRGTAMPFIAFAYRAIPMLTETAARKPWKIAKYMLVAGGLNALAYAMLGADADEDKERAYLPDEKAGRLWGIVPKLIRMPWNRESKLRDGKTTSDPVFLDVRRWIPVGDVVDYGQDKTALPMIPQPLIPGGPAVIAFEYLVNKSAFTGKELTKETDTWVEKAAKVGGHFYKGFMPNVPIPYSGTWAGTKIDNAVKGKEDPLGRAYPVPEAIASGFGLKLERYPVETLQRNSVLDMKGKLRELSDAQRQAARDYGRQGMTRRELDEKVTEIVGKKNATVEEYKAKERKAMGR